MVLDAIGDEGPAVGVVWQVDKSTKAVADTLERTARRVGANARRVGRIERWVEGSVATLSDGGLPDGGVPESPVDPTPWTKGGSPHWSPGVWERDRLYRFTPSCEDAHAIYVRRMRMWARVQVYSTDPVDTPQALISKVKGEAKARA